MTEPHPIDTLWTPGAVHELRVPKAGKHRTWSGYFDDPDAFTREAARLDRLGVPGVYFTVNPVDPALLARAANQAIPYAEATTADRDVAYRRWLVVDLDPVRPANIPSTDEEHRAAQAKALEIDGALSADGWPDPIYMDSGNGTYLLYRIDLPNDDPSRDLLRRALDVLHQRHSDGQTKVDTTMYNAARIIRVPGTTNRKGSGTPDRPHRLSRLLDAGANPLVVPTEAIADLAGAAMEARTTIAPASTRPGSAMSVSYDPQRVLQHLRVTRDDRYSGDGQRWEFDCPENTEHRRNGWIIQDRAGKLYAGCNHDSCTWQWADLRERYDPKTPRPERTATRPAEPRMPALAEQLDLYGGADPAGFWDERPALRHIHQAARARLTSPWAVLGRVLLRVAAATPPWLVLPPIIGGEVSLNLYVAVVDSSGGGKSSAAGVGDHAIDGLGGYINRPIGTGEGLVSLYMRAVKQGQQVTYEQHNTAAILHADEIGSLFAQNQRAGSTIGPYLRSGWTGQELGNAYRDKEKDLQIRAHRYRLCLWVGAQPGMCGPLMSPESIAAGDPQRFVYLPATDPDAPENLPTWPPPLIWRAPRWGDAPPPGVTRQIPVCAAARAEIIRDKQAANRGEARDPLDGHRLLLREKVAAILAILDGRYEVGDDDWRLAALVMQASNATRELVRRTVNEMGAAQNRNRAKARAAEAVEIQNRLDEDLIHRTCAAVTRKLSREAGNDNDGWVNRRDVRLGIDTPLRSTLDTALNRLIDTGAVETRDEIRGQNKTASYRIVGNQ